MLNQSKPVVTCCGRPITGREFAQIKETVAMFGNLSRKELTHTICEHLNWRTPSGTNKWDACAKLLRRFEREGHIVLPPKQPQPRPKKKAVSFTGATKAGPKLQCRLDQMGEVSLELAETPVQVRLWNEYTARHHYLGYKKPFGYHVRYFVKTPDHILGCLLFSGAARAIAPRDKWIGWKPHQRLRNLPWVINNTRSLIFPWIEVKNLASHTLGKARQRITQDWESKWGFSPVLMETFVDPEFYPGTSYLAANWQDLGMTTGQGLVREGKAYKTSPKKILVLPLVKDFRARLCR